MATEFNVNNFRTFIELLVDFNDEINANRDYKLDISTGIVQVTVNKKERSKLENDYHFHKYTPSTYCHDDVIWNIFVDDSYEAEMNEKKIQYFEELVEEYKGLQHFFNDFTFAIGVSKSIIRIIIIPDPKISVDKNAIRRIMNEALGFTHDVTNPTVRGTYAGVKWLIYFNI